MSEAQKEAERQAIRDYAEQMYPVMDGKAEAFLSGYEFREHREWVDVKERLPEETEDNKKGHQLCLCYVDKWGIMVLAWNFYHKVWDGEDMDDVSSYNNKVTHWQPLPSPPNKG